MKARTNISAEPRERISKNPIFIFSRSGFLRRFRALFRFDFGANFRSFFFFDRLATRFFPHFFVLRSFKFFLNFVSRLLEFLPRARNSSRQFRNLVRAKKQNYDAHDDDNCDRAQSGKKRLIKHRIFLVEFARNDAFRPFLSR